MVLAMLLALWGVAGAATPSIEAQIGFNGHVVPERYAPLRVDVRGLSGVVDAQIRVTQTLGTPWRGTASVLQEPRISVTGNGIYRTTIPLYDPFNPVLVSLIDASGRPLAEQEVDLRSTRRLDPFPLLYGMLPYPIDPDTPPVNATDLPSEWWAYDAAESLWISAAPPQESWDAIARWVYAGGTAVLLTGPDFFRLDSPIVRELLPLDHPALASNLDGRQYLTGTPKSATATTLHRDSTPLLYIRQYGAGHVALVTMRAADLTPTEIASIADATPPASRLTLNDVSETLLGALHVVRPSYSAVILLIVVSLVGFGISAAVGRRHRKAAIGSLSALFVLLAVLSGLYANSDHTVITKYAVNTILQLHTSFGLYADSYSILWREAGLLIQPTTSETIPLQIVSVSAASDALSAMMPQSQVFPEQFEHTFAGGRIEASIDRNALKSFSSYGNSQPAVRLTYNTREDRLILDQVTASPFEEGWFLVDGLGFRVTSVPQGLSIHTIDDMRSLRELIEDDADRSIGILSSLSTEFPFHRGVWFVGHAEGSAESRDERGQKVRLVTLHVVEGSRHD